MKELLISQPLLFALVVATGACILCIFLISLLLPLLQRHALVRPNERSSHRVPTPQGGGLPVVAATLIASVAALNAFGAQPDQEMLALALMAVFLGVVGAWDDLKPISVSMRLVLQSIAIVGILLSIPPDVRICPTTNLLTERLLIAIAALWFVNLVNFMDGLDWLTVAEVVPVTAVLVMIGGIQAALPWETTLVAAALCGGILGFAPFNKPVARLFLGDAGSLPVGLLLGWCLLRLAASGHLAAAILLPMYYLGDGTITLARRTIARKPIWQSHREHFYQRATDNGFTPRQIASEVFLLNVFLGVLALISIAYGRLAINVAAFAVGAVAVAFLLRRFNHRRK